MLDTNVWLDLLLFADTRTTALRAALDAGTVAAVVDTECRDEWLRVLHYPVLRLDPERIDATTAAFDALAQPWPTPAETHPLPRCADPDDQKFLHLAHAADARWLLSRDRALLALARRCRREGLFEILAPDAWSQGATARSGRTA